MAHCITHNISFDPQWEWCIYCGKPKIAELVVVESTSTNSAIDEIATVLSTCKGATISDSNMIGVAVIKLRQLRQ